MKKRILLKLRNDIIDCSFSHTNERIVMLDDILDLFDKILEENNETNKKGDKNP